jgi:RNA polymerase sigma-70 factor (ECF subfamily)
LEAASEISADDSRRLGAPKEFQERQPLHRKPVAIKKLRSRFSTEYRIVPVVIITMSPKQIANLIDAHSPALLLYARQFCDVAEDVVQEALLKLMAQQTWPTEVIPWLYRVVRNAALDAVKTQRRREKRERDVARATPWFVEAEIDGLDAETAANALRELPIDLREAIVAHLWGGLTFEQIAELSGTAASTACRRYRAGIVMLREKLGASCPNNPK